MAAKYGSVGGLLVFGTTTSLFAKLVYEIPSVGADGETKLFTKPWAMTSLMFIGMSFCLPLALWIERKQRAQHDMEVPLLAESQTPKAKRSDFKEIMMLAIPTFFDLLATILMNVGLLYVTASVYQMMRGAEMLFAALFAIAFLGRKLNRFHLGGISCCLLGVILVGTSSYLGGQGSVVVTVTPEQNLIGMGLIVISQAVQAAQLTFEDFFMADLNIAPAKIVAWEGVFGVIGTLGIMAPIAYFLPGKEGEGVHENILDTFTMIGNSRTLQVILLVDCAALALYNMVGMMVTGQLGAVFRTVLETMRTLFVWLMGLLLFYAPFGMGRMGESWNSYSWLQAAGFAVLVAGTLVYQRGEQEGMRQEMLEAMAVQAAQEPVHEEGVQGYSSVMTAGSPLINRLPATAGYSIPDAGGAAGTFMSMPMDMAPSSFKANQTIGAGSYTRGAGSYIRRSHMAPQDE
eukprot:CAMPEP_0119110376 /NCGR_PEP_ID=MMETSP1180-20130426/29240_1 /TAXON_ID=3052 ORGANISM="Chlamydomonas cf sp, Strain CCMP681" /NCGR_SAMPLE_ID=MMETSP1180 /ASSEMBLY_ACC=CAM_ASM_000741 /LENGTH=458 /DNA_ID=CAMNT_0007096685 /DNA_START=1 /DNA_END=1377 /DNA_ORIENTATION=+